MSVYQKFIASASPPRDSTASSTPTTRVRLSHKKPFQPQLQHQTSSASQRTTMMMMRQQHSAQPSDYSKHQTAASAQHQHHKHTIDVAYQPENLPQVHQAKPNLYHNLSARPTSAQMLESLMKTEDPLLLRWLQAMRFETELECLTSLQARTLAIDEHSAGALSVRNSQVNIQEMRSESQFILEFIDNLIDRLPLQNLGATSKFCVDFTELWTRIMSQTSDNSNANSNHKSHQTANVLASKTYNCNPTNNLTIINCTPRKVPLSAKSGRPLDELVVKIRALCVEFANLLYDCQENSHHNRRQPAIDNGSLESSLRKLKELYGRFVEISILAECANIVRALNYDFSQSSLNRLSSTSSLLPARPFESSSAQLPLKWALIALWQLTKDDSYICRTLTENWRTKESKNPGASGSHSRVAKRLDYSTKYDASSTASSGDNRSISSSLAPPPEALQAASGGVSSSLRSDYMKMYEICQNHHATLRRAEGGEGVAGGSGRSGALSSALKVRQQELESSKNVSPIELLIEIIISQPNKHERLDMMNFVHSQANDDKLIDLDEWDQSVSAAIYTSNQYKVAALRILNHLCVNDQAVKTILKCFSTPPPTNGHPMPENKIIRSIFECYQTAQEHIYQNDTMFYPSQHQRATPNGGKRSKRSRPLADDWDEYSDYGSRQTSSIPTSGSHQEDGQGDEEGDDLVVKEAIRLLIQLTTVFHASKQPHDYYTLIGRFSIESLVKYLTNIIKSTSSREMLLLSLGVLANISFITTEPMKVFGINRIILEMFRASKVRSKDLELRDQALTILANAADKNLLDIISNGGLTFLLSCLESCPTKMANYKQLIDKIQRSEDPLELDIENKPRNRRPIDFSNNQYPDFLDCACDQQQEQTQVVGSNFVVLPSLCLSRLSPNELAAMERIHQKTAIAFARMSSDASTIKLVLKYGGVKQLIDLCKFSHKRNHSNIVLIACIVALRKMAKIIDSETFRYYNALDLIELDSNTAVEIYGAPQTANESTSFTDRQRIFASHV